MSSNDYFRQVSSYFIPFFFGVLMGKYKSFYNIIANNSIVFTMSLFLFCSIVGYFSNSYQGISNKIIRLSTGLLSLPILFNFFSHVQIPKLIVTLASVLGLYTLPIYLMHFYFIKGIPFPNVAGVWFQFFYFGSIAVLISLTCVFLSKILERVPMLSFLFLGKKV